MNTVHNPPDIDMAALKKGEVDLGTSMYLSYLYTFWRLLHGYQIQRWSNLGSRHYKASKPKPTPPSQALKAADSTHLYRRCESTDQRVRSTQKYKENSSPVSGVESWLKSRRIKSQDLSLNDIRSCTVTLLLAWTSFIHSDAALRADILLNCLLRLLVSAAWHTFIFS